MPHWKDVKITQSQKLEALGQLAGGVAHDFNNVLSIIEGYARLIKRQIPEDNPAYEQVEHILEASRRGTSLTRRLLAFGRRKVQGDQACDLVSCVRDYDVLLKPLLMPRVNTKLQLLDETICVSCDRDVVWQVLLNLCINARDAMPDGGTIEIKVVADDTNTTLTITDGGCGMSDEVAKRAFDPFFTTKEQGKGTGLGLPMIYGMINQLGGAIDLKTAEGYGTTVTVTFPICKDEKALNAPRYCAQNVLKGRTVLIVEDEEELLKINEALFQSMEMKTLTASSGDEALIVQDTHKGKIDFLFTDIIMPGMHGAKLAELITSLRPETSVVYITGYPAQDRRLEDVALPKDATILLKPADPEEIEQALKASFDKKRQKMLQFEGKRYG